MTLSCFNDANVEDLFESDERAANKQRGLDEAEGDLS